MTDQNYTHITIVLDKSGSMGHLRADTIGGINSFIAGQREVEGQVTVTLNQFSASWGPNTPAMTTTHDAVSLADFPQLTNEDYVPGGGTALLDAIAKSAEQTGATLAAIPETRRPGKVMFVIITDGEENASEEYSVRTEGVSRVKQIIAHQEEKYGWEVVFLGANLDVAAEQDKLGMRSAYTYFHTAKGTKDLWANLDVGTRRARSLNKSFAAAAADAQHFESLSVAYGPGTLSLDATEATKSQDSEDSENS